jgi:hypothetical protein
LQPLCLRPAFASLWPRAGAQARASVPRKVPSRYTDLKMRSSSRSTTASTFMTVASPSLRKGCPKRPFTTTPEADRRKALPMGRHPRICQTAAGAIAGMASGPRIPQVYAQYTQYKGAILPSAVELQVRQRGFDCERIRIRRKNPQDKSISIADCALLCESTTLLVVPAFCESARPARRNLLRNR